MTKVFISLNFQESGLLSRKIIGFRKRFDPKYNSYSFSHMSVLAPFDMAENRLDDLCETLKEELESFYYGSSSVPKLGFTGLGILQSGKKNILYLNPHYDTDLEYCSEIIKEVCQLFINKSTKYKPNKKQFLPLGMFKYQSDLDLVLEQAKLEFKNYAEIEIESISLNYKKFGVWVEKEILVNFEKNRTSMLELTY